MGLFDIFSDRTGRRTADNRFESISKGLNQAEGEYRQGYDLSRKDYNAGLANLGVRTDQGISYLEDANDVYQPLYDRGMEGIDYYGTLAGLDGGEAGYNAFMDSVDKRVSNQGLQEGMEGIARFRNGGGMLFSGNALQDAMDFGNRYNTQLLGNARSALTPYFDLATNAAGGMSGNLGRIAELKNNLGINEGNFYRDLAGTNKDFYGQLADLKMQRGLAKSNMFGERQAATDSANQNMWNAILGVVGLGANAYAGMA